MPTLPKMLHCDGCTSRPVYLRNLLLLAAGKMMIDLQVMHLRPDLFISWSWWLSWLNPFVMVGPWLEDAAPLLTCCTTFTFFAALVWNSVHRARHARLPHWTGALTALPFINALMLVTLLLAPQGRRPSVLDLP